MLAVVILTSTSGGILGCPVSEVQAHGHMTSRFLGHGEVPCHLRGGHVQNMAAHFV